MRPIQLGVYTSFHQPSLPPLMAAEERKSFDTVFNPLRGSAYFAVEYRRSPNNKVAKVHAQ